MKSKKPKENPSNELFCQQIKKLISDTGLTPAHVARLCGMHKQNLGFVLKGEQSPSYNTIKKILDACGATITINP
jgi:predicted transcriptional regulator